jgi:hypothetical protein
MRQTLKITRWLSDIWIAFLLALIIIKIWGWVGNKDNPFSRLFGVWWLLSYMIGYGLLWGRKFFQKPANKVLSEDKRPPVIYLRSFKDDEKAAAPIVAQYMPVFFTEEEYLVDALNDFGPCVAIGQPSEKLPDLGAARMYLDDDEWQDKVRELLASSSLVVLRAGDTPNFFWEVEQSAKIIKPKNIIILIPKIRYDLFRTRANQYFPKPLPEDIGNPKTGTRLYGYIYFDEDWTSHFIKFEYHGSFWQPQLPSNGTRYIVQYTIRNSLAPIYERLGILIPQIEGGSFIVFFIAFLLSILFMSIFNQTK